MKTYVLYHSNCPDGFGAAFAAWLALGDQNVNYLPCTHGRPVPEMDNGSRVFILDFSFPRAEMLALMDRMEAVLVIDHHPTARKEMDGLDMLIFDASKSGAVLAWEYFHRAPVPEILRYVQDRDLWQWEMVHSREINAALWQTVPRSFNDWAHVHRNWGKTEKKLRDTGMALTFAGRLNIATICERASLQRIGSWTVPVVNSSVMQSEVGEVLLATHPDAPFVGIWFEDELGRRVYSLRSRKRGFDVSLVAKELGGGGHPCAAGFTVAPVLGGVGVVIS